MRTEIAADHEYFEVAPKISEIEQLRIWQASAVSWLRHHLALRRREDRRYMEGHAREYAQLALLNRQKLRDLKAAG